MRRRSTALTMHNDDTFTPTDEQAAAIVAFSDGDTLMLNACAGSGKTATLLAMASTDPRSGLYIVFSKAAAAHARTLFPARVDVFTSHALAVRHAFALGYPEGKLFSTLNAHAIARLLELRDISIAGATVSAVELGHAVRRSLVRYCHSADERIETTHVPCPDRVATFAPRESERYRVLVAELGAKLWMRMRDIEDPGVALGHDGYFKLWSLARPELPYDYVLLDEAQDSNPALIHVLAAQRDGQQVYVGDRYQQIYAWRGAVNAMDRLDARQCALTRSFRYAQSIADFATRLLEPLGNTHRLTGRQDIEGRFVCHDPDVYLSRTNAALVQTLVDLSDQLERVHLIGGGREILALLDDVERLRDGKPASFGELFGFTNWSAVVAYDARTPDSPIKTLVSLVQQFGETRLRGLIEATCTDPARASVTLCTAHRAKGLEFDEVCLAADFPAPVDRPTFIKRYGETALVDAIEIPSLDGSLLILREELRILYVAVTRARRAVALPPWCHELFADTVGPASTLERQALAIDPASLRSRATYGALIVPSTSNVYAIIDFETTGLNPARGDRVIEIGISRLVDGREADTFSTLVNPGIPIPSFITELTGITDEMVRKAPSARAAFEQAMAFIGDAVLVAHNASFDRKFLRHELRQTLGVNDERDVLCTLKLSRRIFQSFASHKLGDIASELGISSSKSHQALADAQVTAAAFATMLERLRVAHPDAIVDAAFLAAYERKPKASLPDLTSERQARDNVAREVLDPSAAPVTPKRANETRSPRKPSSSPGVENRVARAVELDRAAAEAIDTLERLLEDTLSVDDRLDWSSLVSDDPFRSSVPRRSWASYDGEGRPLDIEYRSLEEPRPTEPVFDTRPDARVYAPRISWWHRVTFRAERRRHDAAETLRQAKKAWERDRQIAWVCYVEADNAWKAKAEDIDRTNEWRYAELVVDRRRWEAERQAHDERVEQSRRSVQALRESYERRSPSSVETYVAEVLSRSSYPEDFPTDVSVDYASSARTIEVSVRVLHPDDLPTVQSVSYVKSRDDIKTKLLPASRRNALYADIVRAVCVRTLHEVFESDTVDALEHAIVNGYVESVDPATGHDAHRVIASVAVSKRTFSALRLDRVRASDCFDGLGGRGSARGLAKLTAVEPFVAEDVESTRTV